MTVLFFIIIENTEFLKTHFTAWFVNRYGFMTNYGHWFCVEKIQVTSLKR